MLDFWFTNKQCKKALIVLQAINLGQRGSNPIISMPVLCFLIHIIIIMLRGFGACIILNNSPVMLLKVFMFYSTK